MPQAGLIELVRIVFRTVGDLEKGDILGHPHLFAGDLEEDVEIVHVLAGRRMPVDMERQRARKSANVFVKGAGFLGIAAAIGGMIQAIDPRQFRVDGNARHLFPLTSCVRPVPGKIRYAVAAIPAQSLAQTYQVPAPEWKHPGAIEFIPATLISGLPGPVRP